MNMEKRNLGLLGFFYLIAHGGILLIPNAIFWDDWVIFNNAPSIVLDQFRQAGSMFNVTGILHNLLLSIGPWIYKILTFVLMFGSGLILNLILKRNAILSPGLRFAVVLLFLILPFNLARVALIDFPYTLCYFLFFLAWSLIQRARMLALAIFFLSFNTNSLLVFYAVPMFEFMYRSVKTLDVNSILKFMIQRLDFMLLPFIYFFIKIYFYLPTGEYAGYNQNYSLLNLLSCSSIQIYDFTKMNVNLWSCTIFSILTFILIQKINVFVEVESKNSKNFLLFSIIVLILGLFPYWIIGAAPSFFDWQSRHQLLMPLGGAFLIVWIIFMSGAWRQSFPNRLALMSIVIGVSITINVSTYYSYYIDWQKQINLVQMFKLNENIKRADLIIFDDRTTQYNAVNRTYRFYEWNGLLQKAFGDEKRFGMQYGEHDQFLSGQYNHFFAHSYKAGEFSKIKKFNSVLVVIDVQENQSFKEKLMSKIAPNLRIKTSPFELTR